MKFIKTIVLLFGSLLALNTCSSQLYISLDSIDQGEISKIQTQGIGLAKKILREDCRKDKNRIRYWDGTLSRPRKQYDNYDIDSLTFIPIPLFSISSDATQYDNSDISKYLQWKEELIGFFTFREEEFEGILDWSGEINFGLKKDCSYFTVNNSSMTIDNKAWQGYKYLVKNKRDISFLFGVKYFISTLWFLERDKVYILDLNEMNIYNPEEFINAKCNDSFIKDIANGGTFGCNY